MGNNLEKNNNLIMIAVAALVIGGGLGYLGAQSLGGQQAARFRGASDIDLPAGVVQLSPVIPMMGAHWANPAELPLGPIYLLTDDGKLLGIEYMYSEDMLEELTIPTPEGDFSFLALGGLPLSMPDIGFEKIPAYLDVGLMPQGHDGFEVEHWDIHVYFVSQAELGSLTAPPR